MTVVFFLEDSHLSFEVEYHSVVLYSFSCLNVFSRCYFVSLVSMIIFIVYTVYVYIYIMYIKSIKLIGFLGYPESTQTFLNIPCHSFEGHGLGVPFPCAECADRLDRSLDPPGGDPRG